jgi:hypothetical protein
VSRKGDAAPWLTETWFWDFALQWEGHDTPNKTKRGGNMKKLFALVVLSLSMATPSFGADVVGHSAEVVGKDSYKAVKVSAKETDHAGKDSYKAVKFSATKTGHAGKAVVKFLF